MKIKMHSIVREPLIAQWMRRKKMHFSGWVCGVLVSLILGCGSGGGQAEQLAADTTEFNPFHDEWPAAGNTDGRCTIPTEANAADSSRLDQVVGTGTAESCTGDAFREAVARGGVITFDCGPDPVIVTLSQPAKIFNNTGPEIVIDGGGKVTLSGGGKVRILYMNSCDRDQVWTTSHCQNQDHPRLTVQNLTFIQGDASGQNPYGGGAIFVRGGRFKIVNCRFFNNMCDLAGPDVGGAAVRVLSQYENRPVHIVNSTFGGRDDLGNIGANGGGVSSIGVSFTIINSLMSHNEAVGWGANPQRSGTREAAAAALSTMTAIHLH